MVRWYVVVVMEGLAGLFSPCLSAAPAGAAAPWPCDECGELVLITRVTEGEIEASAETS